MAIEPRKGHLIRGDETSNNTYDDILGAFREGLLKKAQNIIEYYRGNVKRKKNKEFVGVGVWDNVNSPANEGTWKFRGSNNPNNNFEGRSYDIYYMEDPADENTRRRIQINDVFEGKNVKVPNDGKILLDGTWEFPGKIVGEDLEEVKGQVTAGKGRTIFGTTDNRDYAHSNGTWGGVREGEFGQSFNHSVAWNIAKFMKVICGVRKAQFFERMAKTDRKISQSPPFTVGGVTINSKNNDLKSVQSLYTWSKLDGFNGWTHFDPTWWSSTDNYAWEIMKKLTQGNLLRGPFGDIKNNPANNAGNRPQWRRDPVTGDYPPDRMGPNADPYGVKISAQNLKTIFERMEDEWKDIAKAENRKIFVLMDYCHTSCHANCHTTYYPSNDDFFNWHS